jgi:hypothetical protein
MLANPSVVRAAELRRQPPLAEAAHERLLAQSQVATREEVMFTKPRSRLTALLAGAAIMALTIGAALVGPAEGRSSAAAPSAWTAEDALVQITGADGVVRFDVAEDGTRFVWADKPVFDDGLPAHGATYISQGYIYPAGTLTDEIDGVNADGSPEFPDKVLGDWYCYGWYIGDGAHATEGPWVISTQLYNFGGEWGEATLVSEGYVLSQTGGMVSRAITGGTGPFANERGEMADTSLGFNETEGANARYEVNLFSSPDVIDQPTAAQLRERPLRGA